MHYRLILRDQFGDEVTVLTLAPDSDLRVMAGDLAEQLLLDGNPMQECERCNITKSEREVVLTDMVHGPSTKLCDECRGEAWGRGEVANGNPLVQY